MEKADDANRIIKDINVKLGNENATTKLSTWEKIGEATGKLLSKANDVIVKKKFEFVFLTAVLLSV